MRIHLKRTIFRQQTHRQPKHARPSPRSQQRIAISLPRSGGRHYGGSRQSNRIAGVRSSDFGSIPSRNIRIQREPRLPQLWIACSTVSVVVGKYLVGVGRYRALFILFAVCTTSAGVVIEATHFRSAERPQIPIVYHAAQTAPTQPSSPSFPQYDSKSWAPRGGGAYPGAGSPAADVPPAISKPPISVRQPDPAAPAPQDLAREVNDLPPGLADDDLEAALNDLDRQADVDNSLRRQAEPGSQMPADPSIAPSDLLQPGP